MLYFLLDALSPHRSNLIDELMAQTKTLLTSSFLLFFPIFYTRWFS